MLKNYFECYLYQFFNTIKEGGGCIAEFDLLFSLWNRVLFNYRTDNKKSLLKHLWRTILQLSMMNVSVASVYYRMYNVELARVDLDTIWGLFRTLS